MGAFGRRHVSVDTADPVPVEEAGALAEELHLQLLLFRKGIRAVDTGHGFFCIFKTVVVNELPERVDAVRVKEPGNGPPKGVAALQKNDKQVLQGLDRFRIIVGVNEVFVVVRHDLVLVFEVPVKRGTADFGFPDNHIHGRLVKAVFFHKPVKSRDNFTLGAGRHMQFSFPKIS